MSRRNMRYQAARSRAYRNMRAIQRRSKKETFLWGIGEGLVFLIIGGVIFALNLQKAGGQSIIAALQGLPTWVWLIGGSAGSFGLCWSLKNAWLLISLVRTGEIRKSLED